jgi:hypothetical protein
VTSCSNKETFTFEILNKSNFKIEKLNIGCAIRDTIIAIDPLDKVSTELIFEQSTLQVFVSNSFKDAEFCIKVLEYSDFQNSFKNSNGIAVEINRLDNQRIIPIEIEYDNQKGFIFNIKTEEGS